MKIVVIGDIHGRKVWKRILKNEPDYDLIIFLGDYVSTHDDVTAKQQIDNLKKILQFKEDNSDKVILLRGNHDFQHLAYDWAQCSGYDEQVEKGMIKLKTRYLKDTQWLYKYNNIIFSHAGISNTWLNSVNLKDNIEGVNNLKPNEVFGFTPDHWGDCYGDSVTQPLTWIRPQALLNDFLEGGYTQVVGHTTVFKLRAINTGNGDLWLCDTLPYEYLVIDTDTNEFIIKNVIKETIRFQNRDYDIVALVNVKDNKYILDVKNGYRVIKNTENNKIEAVDPSGGPYMTVGYKFYGIQKEIKDISEDSKGRIILTIDNYEDN